jgi:hypothetical protein
MKNKLPIIVVLLVLLVFGGFIATTVTVLRARFRAAVYYDGYSAGFKNGRKEGYDSGAFDTAVRIAEMIARTNVHLAPLELKGDHAVVTDCLFISVNTNWPSDAVMEVK